MLLCDSKFNIYLIEELESYRFIEKNKAAGTRARKISLEIEKAMKEFRKVSVEASK